MWDAIKNAFGGKKAPPPPPIKRKGIPIDIPENIKARMVNPLPDLDLDAYENMPQVDEKLVRSAKINFVNEEPDDEFLDEPLKDFGSHDEYDFNEKPDEPVTYLGDATEYLGDQKEEDSFTSDEEGFTLEEKDYFVECECVSFRRETGARRYYCEICGSDS